MGRVLRPEYVKYGSGRVVRVGTGIALPTTHPSRTTPGTPPPPVPHRTVMVRSEVSWDHAVGLISVDQLSLYLYISDIRGITEVYNVVTAGNPNDHYVIPGTE